MADVLKKAQTDQEDRLSTSLAFRSRDPTSYRDVSDLESPRMRRTAFFYNNNEITTSKDTGETPHGKTDTICSNSLPSDDFEPSNLRG